MNARAVWKQLEEWLHELRTAAPPEWERTRARGMALFMGIRGVVGAFLVGAYFAAEAAIDHYHVAGAAFFTGDYAKDWVKGLVVGFVGGCVVGFWDWQMNEGAYRRARRSSLAQPRK